MSEEVNPTSGNCWLWLMVHFQFKSDCVISRCSVQQQCRSSRMAGDAVEKLTWPQTPPYTPCTPGDFCCMLLYLYCFLCSMAVCEPNSTFALPFFPKTLIKKMLWDMSVSTHLGRHPGVGTLCSPDISLTLDKLRIELMKHVLWIWSWQIPLQSFFITFRKKKFFPPFWSDRELQSRQMFLCRFWLLLLGPKPNSWLCHLFLWLYGEEPAWEMHL